MVLLFKIVFFILECYAFPGAAVRIPVFRQWGQLFCSLSRPRLPGSGRLGYIRANYPVSVDILRRSGNQDLIRGPDLSFLSQPGLIHLLGWLGEEGLQKLFLNNRNFGPVSWKNRLFFCHIRSFETGWMNHSILSPSTHHVNHILFSFLLVRCAVRAFLP